ncbi:MAG: tetratricopeptide repeat protein [Candidatus Omnitrophica bacterium]|nr:tetratricopeptide repeat protein [Candidatus Omnitrophota bacterium]
MAPSFIFLLGHCIAVGLFFLSACVWKIDKRWAFFFAFLVFINPTAVFLIWGPFRSYALYAAVFIIFLLLSRGTGRFHIFLKTQEAVVRFLFWSAVSVFGGAVLLTSISQINLRRDALTFWRYESRQHPTSQVMTNLADAYERAQELSKAQEFYQKAIQMDPQCIKAYVALARMATQRGAWEASLAYNQKIIALKPQDAQAYLGMGEAYRAMGRGKEAVEIYSRLLERFPDNEEIYVKVIEAYGQAIKVYPQDTLYQEKREEVLADLEELSKRRKYSATDYFHLGFLYEQVGGKEEAMRFYTKAVQMQPDYAQALYNLALLYQDSGNYKTALELYGRLLHFHPKFVSGYLNMGMIFNALGDQSRARQFYLKVIALDGDNGNAYFDLGYLSESQGEMREAINYYEKAIEVSPKNAEAYYNLGNVYAGLGQHAEAIALYLKTVGINPRHQDAFVNLSILSFKSRDFAGAIHYLEQAKALGYNPPAEYLKTLEPYRK